jgi:cholesterol transport system auxiliary component
VPDASVKLDARLTEELGQAVVASQTFAASRRATSADLPDVVEAYDQALAAVLTDLIPWTLKTPAKSS